jgi:hypothetical protein
MAIPETQLATWTAVGSVQQSSTTYQSIKRILEHGEAPYATRNIDSFLQGSYGNDTNVYGADSDVDIVLRVKSFFHYDIESLSEADKTTFRNAHPSPSAYNLTHFRTDAVPWLTKNFATDLDTSGTKALRLKANGNRRSSDILLVAPHKRYLSFRVGQDPQVVEGVLFLTSTGKSIVNYPKQHSDNLTQKHKDTGQRFKPTVRIYKNIRNRMVSDGIIKAGTAPSYFIEGMLSNVPAEKFGQTHQYTVEACWDWINAIDQGDLKCANGIHPLSRDNLPTSWPVQGFIDFLQGVQKLWSGW